LPQALQSVAAWVAQKLGWFIKLLRP
jgi:hypothetical protein